MKGRKPNITALPGALDKAPPAPAWLPEFAKTERAPVVPALVKARSLAQHELSTRRIVLPTVIVRSWRQMHVEGKFLLSKNLFGLFIV